MSGEARGNDRANRKPETFEELVSDRMTDTTKENNMTGQRHVAIDGVQYAPVTDIRKDSTVRIVVLQRGWVVVGYYSEEGDRVTVENACVIRKWGTTRGLGELIDGPTADTVLDPAGLVMAHRLGVVLTIAANETAWAGVLS